MSSIIPFSYQEKEIRVIEDAVNRLREEIKAILCKNCKYWDVSCYECDHPDNRTHAEMQPHYRSVRRCGPLFGCIFFEEGNKGKDLGL